MKHPAGSVNPLQPSRQRWEISPQIRVYGADKHPRAAVVAAVSAQVIDLFVHPGILPQEFQWR